MSGETLLFVEDDASGRELGTFNLKRAGYVVDAVDSAEAALELFDASRHQLVVTDLRLPGKTGLELLSELKRREPNVPVIVVTAYGEVDTAVAAMKEGAADFVGKPFNRDHLLLSVRRALERRALLAEVTTLRRRANGVERPMVFDSAVMQELLSLVDRVAGSDATVLVTGETGTGKELIARRIHAQSPRVDGAFVAVSCGAIPAELLESELFGHTRGAFTGAAKERTGRFRQAHGGTLFLDEIGELPTNIQVKLLRVLQERKVDIVGSDEPAAVDVRVIAATHRDLEALVASGEFRQDLLYRLNVVELHVPPLRERLDEIPSLVRHFVDRFAGGRELRISDELIAELGRRAWPGNVRQLENVCERLVVLCPGDELRARDLPPAPRASEEERPVGDWPELPAEGLSLIDLERRVIERVLALKQGNVTQAAAYLQVPRHVLAYRMQKYGLRRD